jgi:hypothetical protein
MNLTIDFELNFTSDAIREMSNIVLTDRGGFANLIQTYSEYNHDDPQSEIQLEQRAYKAAWLSNVMTMAYVNVTNPKTGPYAEAFEYLNSEVGKTFPLSFDYGSSFTYDSFLTSMTWGGFLNLSSAPDFGGNFTSNATNSSTMSSRPSTSSNQYPNPFQITTDNFTSIGKLPFAFPCVYLTLYHNAGSGVFAGPTGPENRRHGRLHGRDESGHVCSTAQLFAQCRYHVKDHQLDMDGPRCE